MGLFGHSHDDGSGFPTDTPEEAYEAATDMGFDDIHTHEVDGELKFGPGESHEQLAKRDPAKTGSDGMRGLFDAADGTLGKDEGPDGGLF